MMVRRVVAPAALPSAEAEAAGMEICRKAHLYDDVLRRANRQPAIIRREILFALGAGMLAGATVMATVLGRVWLGVGLSFGLLTYSGWWRWRRIWTN